MNERCVYEDMISSRPIYVLHRTGVCVAHPICRQSETDREKKKTLARIKLNMIKETICIIDSINIMKSMDLCDRYGRRLRHSITFDITFQYKSTTPHDTHLIDVKNQRATETEGERECAQEKTIVEMENNITMGATALHRCSFHFQSDVATRTRNEHRATVE